jgi:hypothetical protein
VDDGGIVRLWNASAEQILLAAQIDSGGLRLDREGSTLPTSRAR